MDIYYKLITNEKELRRLFKSLNLEFKPFDYLNETVKANPIYMYFDSENLAFYDYSVNLYTNFFQYENYDDEEYDRHPNECKGVWYMYKEFPKKALTINKNLYKKVLKLN